MIAYCTKALSDLLVPIEKIIKKKYYRDISNISFL